MPSSSPYVRPGLWATRNGISDPLAEVEDWLDDLSDVLEDRIAQDQALRAYDLLVHWARLRRVRPELICEAGGGPEWERLQQLVRSEGPAWAPLALTVPNPSAWHEQAEALDASYEELLEPGERSPWAEQVLTELDEAGLARWAARQFDVLNADLERELDECVRWLTGHADSFLAAGVFVQSVGQTLRPDLAELDPGLAGTAALYEHVLDALEWAEADLAHAGPQTLTPAAARELFRMFGLLRETDHPADESMSPIMRAPDDLPPWGLRPGRPVPAAAATGTTQPLFTHPWNWVSPDGRLLARLSVPVTWRGDDDAELCMTFHLCIEGHPPARELAGQCAVLASVPAEIDTQAQARFRVGLLRDDAAARPVLGVGSGVEDFVEWRRTEP